MYPLWSYFGHDQEVADGRNHGHSHSSHELWEAFAFDVLASLDLIDSFNLLHKMGLHLLIQPVISVLQLIQVFADSTLYGWSRRFIWAFTGSSFDWLTHSNVNYIFYDVLDLLEHADLETILQNHNLGVFHFRQLFLFQLRDYIAYGFGNFIEDA